MMKDATRAILYLIAAEMERQGVKRVEDLKLTETNTDPQKVDLCKLRKLIDREPDKLVVPQCISAPGYESGLAAKHAEQQQNCPYCHSDKDGYTDYFECKNDDCCASIDLDENKITFDNSDGQYTYGTFKINYCPMCGRKLEE